MQRACTAVYRRLCGPPELWVVLSRICRPATTALPLHFSSSGLTRPLAAATRCPRAGLIPTADPGGETVVAQRRTTDSITAAKAGSTAEESPGCDEILNKVRHTHRHTQAPAHHKRARLALQLCVLGSRWAQKADNHRGEIGEIIVWGRVTRTSQQPLRCQTRKWSFTHAHLSLSTLLKKPRAAHQITQQRTFQTCAHFRMDGSGNNLQDVEHFSR